MTRNLAQLLTTQADRRPGLKIGTVDEQMDLVDDVRQAAGGIGFIRQAVLGADGRIALIASNSTDFIVTWMACVLAGVPVALINPTYPPELLNQMLDTFRPELLFTDLDPDQFSNVPLVVAPSIRTDWTPADPKTSPGLAADPLDVVSFMHTSGTTGVPKFCAQSHSYFVRLGRVFADSMELTPEDRLLAPLPLFHFNPMGFGIVGCLTAGADVLCMKKFSASG